MRYLCIDVVETSPRLAEGTQPDDLHPDLQAEFSRISTFTSNHLCPTLRHAPTRHVFPQSWQRQHQSTALPAHRHAHLVAQDRRARDAD